jgi:hypothetical protein
MQNQLNYEVVSSSSVARTRAHRRRKILTGIDPEEGNLQNGYGL